MAYVANHPAATELTMVSEYRPEPVPLGELQHEGSVFVSTANNKVSYIIHPDWLSEEKPAPTKVTPRGAPHAKPSKGSADKTGIQAADYIIAPDWVSERQNSSANFKLTRTHNPWPFEFKDARHWKKKLPVHQTPRASYGADFDVTSRPATGIRLVEHKSGWMPVSSKQGPRAPYNTMPHNRMPSYSYHRAFTTSYGDDFNRTALSAFTDDPPKADNMNMPWRSYNSWNVYAKELARTRREMPPKPAYMAVSASAWQPYKEYRY